MAARLPPPPPPVPGHVDGAAGHTGRRSCPPRRPLRLPLPPQGRRQVGLPRRPHAPSMPAGGRGGEAWSGRAVDAQLRGGRTREGTRVMGRPTTFATKAQVSPAVYTPGSTEVASPHPHLQRAGKLSREF